MGNSDKTILSLCDFSGNWSKFYRDNGYNVIQVDLKRNKQDVRLLTKPDYPVYGILAAPPCTVFANSGAWVKRSAAEMIEGLSIVDACIRLIMVCKPVFWALENPVGKLKRYLGKPTLYFHPCDYGDAYTKKTCLWGVFNIPVKNPVDPIRTCQQGSWIQTLGGKSDRTKELRSMTPLGFAQAFYEANK
jgi:hypothetical protein